MVTDVETLISPVMIEMKLTLSVDTATEAPDILGSPLVDGIFLVQKMCIYSCVTLSTTLLIRAVQFNARSARDASMFTSYIYIFLSLASKCLNCTRSPEEIVQKLHKYD